MPESHLYQNVKVSNLAFILKLLQQSVASRIKKHFNRHKLWDKNLSARSSYQSFHSTENALLRVHNAAFDTMGHKIQLYRLFTKFCITGDYHEWIASYLPQRSQRTKIDDKLSGPLVSPFGAPQRPILGSFLFTLYVNPVGEITKNSWHLKYIDADDSK